jgi:hypothetical protein
MNIYEFIEQCIADSTHSTADIPKPIASVWVSHPGRSMEVCLDTAEATYCEHIAGEGGDIGLSRNMDTKRLAGAYLPLYAKTLFIGGEKFGSIRIDLETGEVTREPA